jgi:hypothetical protein
MLCTLSTAFTKLSISGPRQALHWGLLPATRLASRKILIEQNIKKRTGPALCVLCAPYPAVHVTVHMYIQFTNFVRELFATFYSWGGGGVAC